MDLFAKPRERMEGLLAARRAATRDHERRHHQFGYVRLALGVMLAYSAWKAVGNPNEIPWAFLLCLALFFAVTVVHSRVLRRFEMAGRAVAFYERGIARLAGDYSKAVSTGVAFNDPHHPFSGDLDLFGPGGLFPRICRTRTKEGEAMLANWLLRMEGPPVAQHRLAAAAELSEQLELRESLSVLDADLETSMHPEALRKWARRRSGLFPRVYYWLLPANLLSILCVAAAFWLNIWSPLVLAAAISGFVLWMHRGSVRTTLESTSEAGLDLRVLEGALRLIEENTFQSEAMLDIQRRIRSDGEAASSRIAKLARLAEWIDSLDNEIFKFLDYLLLFSIYFCRAADRWRVANGALVDTWLTAVGEFEALSSLGAWRFENPDAVAPEWITSGPLFEGTGIRHPLIARSASVANDAHLGANCRLLVVSGSNMSGKSTYLRTIGLASVLAHAGGHVTAESLCLSPLTLGASIRTMDSLQEGASRFYAELQRIKAVVDLSRGERPLLFLLDELLSGTNSHDRKIGADGIVGTLLANGAVGLMTTHDLALAEIAGKPGAHAVNVHFQDQIVDGKMTFDYRVKPGVVTTSNALALMRAVGLDVAGI